MQGMELMRCPTCVALLPDPEARRCPLCHTKLRKKKRRGRAIVLGESNRLSGRSLPVDVELHIRAEERFLPDEKRLEEIAHDPASYPAPPVHAPPEPPVVPPAPVVVAKTESVEAVLSFAPSEPLVAAPEPDIDLTEPAEPEPVVDLTTAPTDEKAASGDESMSVSRPKSLWQAVPTPPSSPFDGSLNDMVDELHRKAREDG